MGYFPVTRAIFGGCSGGGGGNTYCCFIGDVGEAAVVCAIVAAVVVAAPLAIDLVATTPGIFAYRQLRKFNTPKPLARTLGTAAGIGTAAAVSYYSYEMYKDYKEKKSSPKNRTDSTARSAGSKTPTPQQDNSLHFLRKTPSPDSIA